jgi:rubredoxin
MKVVILHHQTKQLTTITMAKKINITGYGKNVCPICGGTDFSFNGSNGGMEYGFKGNTDNEFSFELLTYSCRCKKCGQILMQTYLLLGMLTIDQFNELSKEKVDGSVYDIEREKES